MRILYLDCDSLRPDHLGCYGYPRETSPNIDDLAAEGRRFTNYYAADLPCLPSRTGLFTSRFGIHTGVVNHGGLNADIRHRGEPRSMNTFGDEYRTWMSKLNQADHKTTLISSFPQRHGGWPVLDGFQEWHDPGGNGNEEAHVVSPIAEDWLEANATDEDWYLHVNFWDPHAPYSTPEEYGNPFADEPARGWPDEATIREQYLQYGPSSAQEPHGTGEGAEGTWGDRSRMPDEIASREDFVQWINGYDLGIHYMDDHIGQLLDVLEGNGVREETLIIVSADHGENQGECNIYGSHHTADEMTARVPLIVSGPDIEPGVDDGLHYQVDLAPTITELVGSDMPDGWDGDSFAGSLRNGDDAGRDFLVLSMGVWAAQRAVRWDSYLLIRTFHDALAGFEPVELYDLESDPHETTDLARDRPEEVREGLAMLEQWVNTRLLEAATDERGGNPDSPRSLTDPLIEVMEEGGPFHARHVDIEDYATYLRETNRAEHAEKLEQYRGVVPQDIHGYLEGEDVWTAHLDDA